MTVADMKQKWLDFVDKANTAGIPIPLVRDPKSGAGSVSLTLVFLSFNIWIASIIGNVATDLGGINPDQCFNMFMACSALYFGRKFQKDGDKKVDVSDGKQE